MFARLQVAASTPTGCETTALDISPDGKLIATASSSAAVVYLLNSKAEMVRCVICSIARVIVLRFGHSEAQEDSLELMVFVAF